MLTMPTSICNLSVAVYLVPYNSVKKGKVRCKCKGKYYLGTTTTLIKNTSRNKH